MAKKTIPTSVIITAIIALVVLECFAMYNGFNGTMLRIVAVIIAGLAGFIIPNPWTK